MEFVPMTIKKQKNIALIAHDQKKHELMEWCKEHKSKFKWFCYAADKCTESCGSHKADSDFLFIIPIEKEAT